MTDGIGKIVNHTTKRNNCQMRVVELDFQPHLCLFATRDIKCGSELRYDYGVKDLPFLDADEVSLKLMVKISTIKSYKFSYYILAII